LPLETATFILDLVPTNPAHTDGLAQADSHIRLIKSTIKNTLPNFTDVALASTQAQLDAAVAAVAGATALPFKSGTAALPGLFPVGDTDTGFFSPAADQIGISLNGSQVALLASGLLITSLGIGAPAIASTGAYSGGTGQLVPIGAVLEWYDDILPPEGGYAWANGVPISRAANPVLFARWGTKFGAGDGSTTFGVPDRRDTVGVGKSTMGGVSSRGLQTLTNTVLGTLFGLANVVLTTLNLPPYTPAGAIANGAITINQSTIPNAAALSGNNTGGGGGPFGAIANAIAPLTASEASSTFTGSAQGGLSAPVNNVQPSTTCNYIIRIG
jgi:microcystin-dependent protein